MCNNPLLGFERSCKHTYRTYRTRLAKLWSYSLRNVALGCQLLIALFVVPLSLASTVQAAPVIQQTVTLTLQNASAVSLDICDIFLVNRAAKVVLDQQTQFTLAPNATKVFDIAPGTYRLLIHDCAGQTLLQQFNLQISKNTTVSLGNPLETTVPKQDNNPIKECTDVLSAGESLYRHSEFTNALQAFERVLVCAKHHNARSLEATALTNMGVVLSDLGRYTEALANYRKALAIQNETGDRASEGATLNNIGTIFHYQGRLNEALAILRQALAIRQEVGDRAGEGVTLTNIGRLYSDQGHYDEALTTLQQAIVIAREVGDRAGEGAILTNIGGVYSNQGRYAEALTNLHQGLVIRQEVGDRAGEGSSLISIGGVYSGQGRYAEAIESYQQALVISREVGDRSGEGTILGNIGLAYHYQGRYPEALASYQQALTIIRELGDRASESTIFNNIGGIYDNQGRYAEALENYQQALALISTIGDRTGEGATLNNIGAMYHVRGQYVKALDAYQQALLIWRETKNQRSEGITLNNIGEIYTGQGQYPQAMDYLQQALAIHQKIGNRLDEGVTLNNIAEVFRRQGQYARALEILKQALIIRQNVKDRVGEGATLNNIGNIYYAQGQYIKALDSYEQALKIRRAVDDRLGEGVTLNNIGATYSEQGRYVEALVSHQQALQIRRTVNDRAGEGTSLSNIGVVFDHLGRFAEALANLQQALAIRQEVGDRAGESATLNSIGAVYHEQGRYVEALASYQQALTIAREVGDIAGQGGIHYNIGTLYDDQERYDKALDNYRTAIDLLESVRAIAGNDSARISFATSFIDAYAHMIKLTYKDQSPLAFWYSERGRARAFLDSLATGIIQLSDDDANALFLQEQESHALHLTIQDALAKARAVNPPDPELVSDLEQQLKNAEQQHAVVLAAIQQRGDQLAALVPGRTKSVLDLPAVQKLLDPQTTLVSYQVLEDQTLAFMITRDSFHTVALSVTNTTLITQVQTLREFSDFSEAHPASAVQLYEWLIAPLKPYLTTSHLIIVPHGVLHYLPFVALTDGKRFLIDDYTLTMLPSASTLPFTQPHPTLTNTMPLIVGNPATTELPSLNSAEQEAQAIAKLYGVTPLLGTMATTTAVRERAANASILHLAAHGDYDIHDPLASTIYLAPNAAGTGTIPITTTGDITETGQPTDTGHLTVRDIYSWNLNNTNLVVLSACETQMNELSERNIVSAGDDIVGLTRAFFFAGAPSVLATLWSVDDVSSAQLMEYFYTNLQQGIGKAEALRQAQITIRKDYPNPYYWAGFVLSGDDGPLDTASTQITK